MSGCVYDNATDLCETGSDESGSNTYTFTYDPAKHTIVFKNADDEGKSGVWTKSETTINMKLEFDGKDLDPYAEIEDSPIFDAGDGEEK